MNPQCSILDTARQLSCKAGTAAAPGCTAEGLRDLGPLSACNGLHPPSFQQPWKKASSALHSVLRAAQTWATNSAFHCCFSRMVMQALPLCESVSMKALWHTTYDAKDTHKAAYLVIFILCMATLPCNQAIQFAKEKTSGSSFSVCKCLQWVKDYNWEEDWNLQSSWISKTKHHGPKMRVSLNCSQGIFKPGTWDPQSSKVSKQAGKAPASDVCTPTGLNWELQIFTLRFLLWSTWSFSARWSSCLSHTQSTEELHFKMNEGLRDLAFPFF